MRRNAVVAALLAGCFSFVLATQASAQDKSERPAASPTPAQIVALDECDPATFNAAIGPDFCKNVALGFSTTFSDLFAKAAAGTPDPGWDFEPDVVHVKQEAILTAVDQGGEPHTFTEVAQFGGGFLPVLRRRPLPAGIGPDQHGGRAAQRRCAAR